VYVELRAESMKIQHAADRVERPRCRSGQASHFFYHCNNKKTTVYNKWLH